MWIVHEATKSMFAEHSLNAISDRWRLRLPEEKDQEAKSIPGKIVSHNMWINKLPISFCSSVLIGKSLSLPHCSFLVTVNFAEISGHTYQNNPMYSHSLLSHFALIGNLADDFRLDVDFYPPYSYLLVSRKKGARPRWKYSPLRGTAQHMGILCGFYGALFICVQVAPANNIDVLFIAGDFGTKQFLLVLQSKGWPWENSNLHIL